MTMVTLTGRIDDKNRLTAAQKQSAIAGFCYQNGYLLSATDMGNQGVKIELAHHAQDSGAIILPPAKAKECARWMLQTIAQRNHNPLNELPDILRRLVKQKESGRILKWGDKKKIRDALRLLKSPQA
jgi:hypothetical protein